VLADEQPELFAAEIRAAFRLPGRIGERMRSFGLFLRFTGKASWLRPHRGISQEKLAVYLGFFEFVHNVRKRGKALLPALIELLVT
jgi:transposase-like protein